MSIRIENERQLKTAQEFVDFIREHNRKVMEKKVTDEGMMTVVMSQSSMIDTLTKALVEKHSENTELKKQIDDLEREIRVSKDLLGIAKGISN